MYRSGPEKGKQTPAVSPDHLTNCVGGGLVFRVYDVSRFTIAGPIWEFEKIGESHKCDFPLAFGNDWERTGVRNFASRNPNVNIQV